MTEPTVNPFAAPEAPAVLSAEPSQPLYSRRACAVTTFFATPLGAAVLLGINARRTGQSVPGIVGIAVGILVLVIGVGFLPFRVPAIGLSIAQVLAVSALHDQWFKDAVLARAADGIGPAPWWHAALVGVAGFVLQMLLLVALVLAIGMDGLLEM